MFKLVKVSATNPGPENWKDLIPESTNVLSVSSGGGYFFASYLVDVKSVVFQYDYEGKRIREIKFPTSGTASGFNAFEESDGFILHLYFIHLSEHRLSLRY